MKEKNLAEIWIEGRPTQVNKYDHKSQLSPENNDILKLKEKTKKRIQQI